LKERQIPLGARIVLAVDAYQAMTSDRPYRARLSDREAAAELSAGAGSQFDPEVVEALLSVLSRRG
jgi:HD-GYP domain-containing protein (c-di-GMP phosphodiesterase class II)